MATNNPNVEQIMGYVDEHRLPLISNTVLGSNIINYFTLMTGVKGTTALNILETDPHFTCGKECGWHEIGDTTLTQREMCVLPLNVHMSFCDKKLLDTWANYEVKVAAGLKNLPFEEEWTNNIIAKVQKKIEIGIWQGITTDSLEDFELFCKCQGLVPTIEGAKPAVVIDYDTVTTPYAMFVATFNGLPAEVKAADDLIAFVGYDFYYKLIQDIMATSHFHITDEELKDGFYFPGTNVRVVPTIGLDTFELQSFSYENNIVIGRQSNFFYGTDLRNDEEKFDLWYSKDNREFRLAIEFTMGTQIAFPSEIAWSSKRTHL